jgi:hypothetical protein
MWPAKTPHDLSHKGKSMTNNNLLEAAKGLKVISVGTDRDGSYVRVTNESYNDLATAIQNTPESEWQPSETAEADGSDMWVYADHIGHAVIGCYWGDGDWQDLHGHAIDPITHWRPITIPPPPSTTEQEPSE